MPVKCQRPLQECTGNCAKILGQQLKVVALLWRESIEKLRECGYHLNQSIRGRGNSDRPAFRVTCRHASDILSRSNLTVLAFYRLKGV